MDPAIIIVLTTLIAAMVACFFEAARIDIVALFCWLEVGQETLSGFYTQSWKVGTKKVERDFFNILKSFPPI